MIKLDVEILVLVTPILGILKTYGLFHDRVWTDTIFITLTCKQEVRVSRLNSKRSISKCP